MPLIKCYECQKEISTAAVACPHCGAKAKTGNQGCFAALGTVFIFVVLAFMFFSQKSKEPASVEKFKSQDAIKFCWSEYEKKSNTDAEKRFIAKACEQMEEDFVKKYGRKP